MRLPKYFLGVLLGCLALTVVSPVSAHAAGACGGSQGSRFNGYYQNGHPEYNWEGSSTYIVVRDGANCSGVTNIGNFTNAWVMIAGSNANDWAQVGFERTSGHTLRWFSQFNDGRGNLATRYSTFGVTNQIGVRHTFRVLWNATDHHEHATIDTTTWAVSSFDPFANWGPLPWSPQYLEETGYAQTDVPGTAGGKVAYTGMGAQKLDDSLVSIPCILSGADDVPTRWAHQASGCTGFTAWTK